MSEGGYRNKYDTEGRLDYVGKEKKEYKFKTIKNPGRS